MYTELEKMVRELYDRQKIYEVVLNYCRGVDRMDRDLFLTEKCGERPLISKCSLNGHGERSSEKKQEEPEPDRPVIPGLKVRTLRDSHRKNLPLF